MLQDLDRGAEASSVENGDVTDGLEDFERRLEQPLPKLSRVLDVPVVDLLVESPR